MDIPQYRSAGTLLVVDASTELRSNLEFMNEAVMSCNIPVATCFLHTQVFEKNGKEEEEDEQDEKDEKATK